MEHGVGRHRPRDLPTLGAKRVDRGLDQLDFLAAQRAAFPGMGIERGDREPRLGDPEIALQPTQRHPATRFDHRAAQQFRDAGQRDMGGDRDGAKRRPGEHHRHVGGRNAAAFGDEFGLAGVGETDRVELLLADRAGDHRAGRPRAGETDRELERIERAMRADCAWMAKVMDLAARYVEQREPDVEGRIGIAQIVDQLDRAIPDQLEATCIANRDERREAERAAIVPAFGNHLRPDAGGVAKRNCQWWERGGGHPAALASPTSESR